MKEFEYQFTESKQTLRAIPLAKFDDLFSINSRSSFSVLKRINQIEGAYVGKKSARDCHS
jgi:hypothetical protein